MSGVHEQQINYNYPSAQAKAQSGLQTFNPNLVQGSNPGQHQIPNHCAIPIPAGYASLHRYTGGVIVNPIPPSSIGGVFVNPLPPSSTLETGTKPSLRQPSIYNPKDGDQIDAKPNPEEPIYQEIKPRSEKKEVKEEGTKEVEVRNKLEEVPAQTGRKKEVEYWQITAKEVVKFRPCTETFINRS